MNAYLFTAGLTQSQVRPTPGRGGQMVDSMQIWDSCRVRSFTVATRNRRKNGLKPGAVGLRKDENPVETEIKKVVAAQFVDQLLTESGGKPLDWPQISRQVNDILQATPVDDFEQGYWVDINQAVPREKSVSTSDH